MNFDGMTKYGIAFAIVIIALVPAICTILLGTHFASAFGLDGIVWWAFVILFYIIVMGIIGAIANV